MGERYDKLTIMAISGMANNSKDETLATWQGDVDPNIESKPPRPDAVDMDEDEKEMLAEARARLANTRGKKAKRKIREKQMEVSRRISQLQKNRELRAAGISIAYKFNSHRILDYNSEVAFERKPVEGPYTTVEEEANSEIIRKNFHSISTKSTDGKKNKKKLAS